MKTHTVAKWIWLISSLRLRTVRSTTASASRWNSGFARCLRALSTTSDRQAPPFDDLPTAPLAAAMLDAGVRATLACVDTRVVPDAFVGRDFDRTLLAELPSSVDPCGENGEFHTCVHAGPMFAGPIDLLRGERVLRAPFVWTDLLLRA